MSQEPPARRSFWDLFTAEPGGASPLAPFWNLFTNEPAEGTAGQSDPENLKAPADPRVFDENSVFWAMRRLPLTEATKHFLICGTTGSGKTSAIELFLRSIAPRFRVGRQLPEQLIVFDAKCDVVPTLAALGLRPKDQNVWILNPLDQRTAAWNVSQAIDTPAMARHFATLIVPEEPRASTPYFNDGARELVYAVLMSLKAIAGNDWALRDLLCALESTERIQAITDQHPRAQALTHRILNDDLHSKGILSTLGTKLGKFEQVAALWHSQEETARKFSITEFLQAPGVLILGNDPVLRESIWPINAMLLRALTQHILRGPNTLKPRHWFILDEFRAMEKVDSIHDLLNRGRSKGAAVLLGIQSVEGLVDIYQEQRANDILTQCAYKTFLRVGGPKTAEWAEKFFGKVRRSESTLTENVDFPRRNKTRHHDIKERALFISSHFMALPFPTVGTDYVTINDVPCLRRTTITTRPFNQVLEWNRKPKNIEEEAPSVEWRKASDQDLRPWTHEEQLRFCGKLVEVKPKRRRPPPRMAKAQPAAAAKESDSGGKPKAARGNFYG